jgi:hypothetical protein
MNLSKLREVVPDEFQTDSWHWKAYENLMNSRDHLEREGYHEAHHPVPYSLWRVKENSSKVLLTPREHFIAHRLLAKMFTGKTKTRMTWALHRMATGHNKERLNSRQYDIARKALSKELRGKPKSAEHRRKISEANKGKPRTQSQLDAVRRPRTLEQRKRISEFMTGRKLSEEHRRNIGNSCRGKSMNPEAVRRSAETRTGMKMSDSAKLSMSLANQRKKEEWKKLEVLDQALFRKLRLTLNGKNRVPREIRELLQL